MQNTKYIRSVIMAALDFDKIKQDFINADVDEKIRIYTTTEGLSVEQFREL